jgi:3-oxoadipate enol-lactonase
MASALSAVLVCTAANVHAQRVGFAESDGVRLYYEVHGEQTASQVTPVIFIAGLGASTWLWEQQIGDVSADFVVVVFDNRGSGRSDAPAGPYSISMMADDLASLMDDLDVGRAHIVGASMGGLVAQEFALTYPDRVDRLVLVSTTAGGPSHVPMSVETAARFMAMDEDPEELIRMRLPLAFTGAFLADEAVVSHLVRQRVDSPQAPHAYQAQAIAGATFDASERVGSIAAETLVAHATDDLLVPIVNGYRLAEAIPRATLRVYPGLGHQFFVEAPTEFNRDLIAFLSGSPLAGEDY